MVKTLINELFKNNITAMFRKKNYKNCKAWWSKLWIYS